MDYIIFVGLIAGALTTVSILPQLLKTMKLKETKDISLTWCVILFSGVFLWVVYGFLISDLAVLLANGITLVLVFILLLLKLKFG
ncbi:MAG: SemiSWEET transporter [Candidatus Aenigmarchaeota archaeon]|nr:SemiSWEET transporter [Candidatus Aenigmarchaeota archaeon]